MDGSFWAAPIHSQGALSVRRSCIEKDYGAGIYEWPDEKHLPFDYGQTSFAA